MPYLARLLIPFAYKCATFRRPTMFLRNSAARRTARSRPVKVIFSLMPLYPGDGSDCSQPALKLVSEHAKQQN